MLVNNFHLVVTNIKLIKVNDIGVTVYLKTGEFFRFPTHTKTTLEFIKYFAVKSETHGKDNIFYSE